MYDTRIFSVKPLAAPGAVIRGDAYRFTLLTDRLIRMEYAPDGCFEDRPTRLAVCREFPVPVFTVRETPQSLDILTETFHIRYDKKPFSPGGLSCELKNNPEHKAAKWFYGVSFTGMRSPAVQNFGGTTRTLDLTDGDAVLDDGLLNRIGFSTIDDSDSLILNEEGWYEKREKAGRIDLYLFIYGRDYEGCIRDFYALTGKTPMLPRYALGNWWSRYHAYTEETYLELIRKFTRKKIPLSVAVIDMDWHLVDIPKTYGNGWTGYTWNKELFPNPRRFLKKLHENKLAVTLNLHPHDGVRAFEENYPALAESMGIDPASGERVEFDASDYTGMQKYFSHILHPLEDEGVDFWWLDWQQVGGASDPAFDTLFMLNHAFYLDNMRRGRYPLTFSRYAGLGSHRYPIGFSGDTYMTWKSLDYQPYFTATAANVGYGWWSHDIGGHFHGQWDDELQVRWTQFGVFSPIMRLHSGKHPFMLKEPWSFGPREEAILTHFMRLRHKLIPYLYTMNYRTHAEGIPLVRPLYHQYPKNLDVLKYKNEYLFGSDFLVCPITAPMDPEARMGSTDAWLPEGIWIDFFSGRVYRGGRKLTLYRPLETYPVLVKAGAILPMTPDSALENGAELPADPELHVYCGASGSFTLYEDNERLFAENKAARTSYRFTWGEEAVFTVSPVAGHREITPAVRNYTVQFHALGGCADVYAAINGKRADFDAAYDPETHILTVRVANVLPTDELTIRFLCDTELASTDAFAEAEQALSRFHCANDLKTAIYSALCNEKRIERLLPTLTSIIENKAILGVLTERLTANL